MKPNRLHFGWVSRRDSLALKPTKKQGSSMDKSILIPTLNQDFLVAIFGKDWKTAHVTSFSDDPSNIAPDRRGICWSGGYADRLLPPGNQYFTISRFDPLDGRAVRRKAHFIACYVIVADDVGEKLPITHLEQLPPPNYKLLTSSGSQQWGWILLEPCHDRRLVDNLLDGLVKLGLAPDGKDPGMCGVTRYVRLPDGYNSKANRLIDGQPFDCKLLEFDPWSQRFTMDELAEPFKIDIYAERRETATGAASVDHPIVEVVQVKKELSSGRYDITCPWVEDHTEKNDSGTAIWTNADLSIGFKCHHGHCSDRTGEDLIRWIDGGHPGWSKRLDEWKTYKSLGVDKNIDEIDLVRIDPIRIDPIKKAPSLIAILDELLAELARLPKNKIAEEHAFKILRIADKVERVDQIRAHDRVKEHLGWSTKDLKVILKEQRVKWYPREEINQHKQLNFYKFPHKEVSEDKVHLYDTVENTKHLLREYKITTNLDQITKENFLAIPGENCTEEASLIETIIGLVRLHNLPQMNIINRVSNECRENPVNRVVEHLSNLDYRGNGYIQQLAEHITVELGTEYIRDNVLRLWMIMACAAADHAESTPNEEAVAKFDSVMIFVGEQGLKKTQFFKAMLPKPLRQYFNDGQFIDPTDKDSVSECIQWWVVEAGEIDGVFKKADISRFKAFLSKSTDVFRRPYERSSIKYQRRTAFVGSANERDFLKDHTGNRRYWPLLVERLIMPTDENLLNNAWSEAWELYLSGKVWWPEAHLEKTLSDQTKSFLAPITDEPVEEAVRHLIDLRQGAFKYDVLKLNDIRNALKSAGLSGHNVEKIPTLTMLGLIMKRHDLGVPVRTTSGRYWIVRNFEKYQLMSSTDVERYYKASDVGGKEALLTKVKSLF